MTPSELSSTLQPVFDNWYNNLKKHLHAGSLSSSNTIYCQDQINLYETQQYYALELTGATPLADFQSVSFSKKVKKLENLNSLINGGTAIPSTATYNAQLHIQTAGEVWVDLNVGSHDLYDNTNKCLDRDRLQASLNKTASIPVQVHEQIGGLFFADSNILRLEGNKLYLRHLPMLLVIDKKSDPIRLVHYSIARLNETFPKRDRFVGIYDDEAKSNAVAAIFRPNVTSITQEQATAIAQALGYQSAKINVVTAGDQHGELDFFLEHQEGYCDVLSLTAGRFSSASSNGKKSKHNLSAYALERQAQLEQYQSPTIRTALQAQGIQLADNPLLLAVLENKKQVFSQALNKQASTSASNVVLLTVETLNQLVELRKRV